jgi:hypothetical protein
VLRRSFVVLAVAAGAAAAQPSPELTREFQAGVDAFRLGKLDDARAHLGKARDLDPRLPGPHRFLAAVAQAQGQWAECIAEAHRALELNPESTEIAETRALHEQCRASGGKQPYHGADLGDSAAIAVTTSVPGATVKVGGIVYGGTPLAPRPITAGKLQVDVSKVGWKPAHVEADALPGIVTDVEVELEPDASAQAEAAIEVTQAEKQTTAWVIFPNEVNGVVVSEVEVGREDRDCGPRDGAAMAAPRCVEIAYEQARRPLHGSKIELAPGTHTIELESPGHDRWRRRVRLVAGEQKHLDPQFVETAPREHVEHIGLAALAGAGALAVTGFAFALASESAANEARDIQRVETQRDPTQPLSVTGAIDPVRTRAQFDDARNRGARDAIISDAAYGAALAAAGVAAYYLYIGARERPDAPPPFAIAPTRTGAVIAKELRW